jgi:phosphoribosyl-AMP cyclohydrolase
MFKLDFEKGDGLIPAIAQDYETGDVLMLAYINEESWNETLSSGYATYWSRSRSKLWKKGESSGNLQKVKEILVDCDEDTVVFKIEQIGGAACHLGYRSCFFRKVEDGILKITGERVFDPEKVYNR